jgi:hypothetical protein
MMAKNSFNRQRSSKDDLKGVGIQFSRATVQQVRAAGHASSVDEISSSLGNKSSIDCGFLQLGISGNYTQWLAQ